MGDKWELIGKLKSSGWRLRVLKTLSNGVKTPNELSKQTYISSSHISEVLRDLKGMELIECKNPDLRKGKIYSITKLGKNILKELIKIL